MFAIFIRYPVLWFSGGLRGAQQRTEVVMQRGGACRLRPQTLAERPWAGRQAFVYVCCLDGGLIVAVVAGDACVTIVCSDDGWIASHSGSTRTAACARLVFSKIFPLL